MNLHATLANKTDVCFAEQRVSPVSMDAGTCRASGGLAGGLGAKLRFGSKVATEAAAATDLHAQRSPDPPAGRSKQVTPTGAFQFPADMSSSRDHT